EGFVPDGDELGEIESVTLIFFDVGDDEPKVRRDEPLGGLFVTLLRAAREPAFFLGFVDEWELLDVLQILVERGRRRRSEITSRRSSLGHLLHTRSLPCSRLRRSQATSACD